MNALFYVVIYRFWLENALKKDSLEFLRLKRNVFEKILHLRAKIEKKFTMNGSLRNKIEAKEFTRFIRLTHEIDEIIYI